MSTTTTTMAQNPFLVDVVLSTMFRKMSVDSLATARLVCRQWNSLASPHFQHRMLAENKTLNLTIANWHDFVGTFGTGEGVFFWSKIVLSGAHLMRLYPRNMFENYGPRLTHLSLVSNNEFNITLKNFRDLLNSVKNLSTLCLGTLPTEISACLEKLFPPAPTSASASNNGNKDSNSFILPKLTKIKVHLTSARYSSSFFHSLFSAAPMLQSLLIRETNSGFELVDVILHSLGCQFLQLKCLKISQLHESNLKYLNYFSANGMKLEKLTLESLSQEATHTTVFDLLSYQAPTLKYLLIGRPSACRSVFLNFTFPFDMPNLLKLEFWTHSLEWGGIHYSRQLPRLQTIIVRAYRSYHNWTIPLPDPRNIHPGNRCVTVNKIFYVDENHSTENQINLWKLYLLFPSVTRMSVDISDMRTMQTFWTFWTSLEDLEVHLDKRCSLPDSGFTGFTRGTVRDILLNLPQTDLLPVIQPVLEGQVPVDGLAKLPNLKRLIVDVKSSSASNTSNEPYHEISDIFGYFVHFHLTNLEELYINSSRISQRCLDKLREMPKMKSINVRSIRLGN